MRCFTGRDHRDRPGDDAGISRSTLKSRSTLTRGALREDALQGAAMHIQPPGGFRHVAAAEFVHALDMLPTNPIRRHGVFGQLGALTLLRHQGGMDLVGVSGLREVIEGAELHGRDRGRDIAIAGEHDAARVEATLLEAGDDVQAVPIAEAHVDDREGRGLLVDSREALGDTFGNAHTIATGFHGPRQSCQERPVIIDDQKAVVAFDLCLLLGVYHPVTSRRWATRHLWALNHRAIPG
ncbi:hypothetical protein CHELA20_53675 [Hyphomicrobiales bacterium]|nr:hypothetical protein CHELA41_21250 [Hyphomicrobiales bacterium]CAH1684724.1 hypothetical protein CHELA20_53675 [Hyphomicrobiales bacterium]